MRFVLASLVNLLLTLPSLAHAITVQTGSYTGDGLDNKAIALGSACTPSVVLVKRNTAANHSFIALSSMTAGDSWTLTQTTATPSTTCVKTLTATGFTLGTSSSCNGSGVTHYYLAICDNGAGDLSVGSYTGSAGGDNRDITISPAFSPEVVLIIPGSGAFRVWRGASAHSGDDASIVSSASATTANYIQAFNASGFQVGTSYNADTIVFYYVAIKGSAAGVASGNFAGNTNDDRDITTGFQPEFVLVKQDSTTDGPSYRFASQTAGESHCLSEAAATNQIQAFGATTFQVGTDVCANSNGITMHWFALTDVTASRRPIPPVVFE